MRKRYLPSNRTPLLLLAPKADLKSWLFFYDKTIEAVHDDLYFVDNDNLVCCFQLKISEIYSINNSWFLHHQMTGGLSNVRCQQIGVQLLRTCRVPHFNRSYALTMNTGPNGGFKLTFSSDTPICDDLVALGRNSTLLIHEATYPDKHIEKASSNRHCTLSQAIQQSQKMNAKYTVLTHFSRRHNQIPLIDREKYPNIGIAFDFMELTEKDLPSLSRLNEKYQQLFQFKKFKWFFC